MVRSGEVPDHPAPKLLCREDAQLHHYTLLLHNLHVHHRVSGLIRYWRNALR